MVPDTVRHFVGGQHVHSTLRKSYGVTDPATGKEYAQVEVGLGPDVNQAVLAARAALETGRWPEMTATDRARVLSAIADAIDARVGDIAAAEALGPGLPVTPSGAQAARAGGVFRRAADLITARAGTGEVDRGGPSGYLVRRPAGVAGLITPWRSPFLAQARAVAPALAAGCAIVLKPDEWAPLPAALLAEISIAAGLPDGVLNVVHGSLHHKAPGTQARDALISHPQVTRLWFDGAADAGQQVALDAATHRTRLSAELAGTSPCLIFADADLDRAADGALFGAFARNGQRRTATSTILAERPVYEAVVSRLAQRAERIRVGDPADQATELGPLPHADHYDRLMAFVRLGVREGARLAAGGRRPAGLPDGNFLAPTVLADVDPALPGFTDPLGGPVVRVAPFDTAEEAVALANAVAGAVANHPAAAYLWTADLSRARRLAPDLTTASLWVNSSNPGDLPAAVPAERNGAAGQADLDFFTQPLTVRVAADETPAAPFGG
ncbi:MAG TPA: aldehyde dehydrogenase family protein [Trebonia sp.]|nr:aldehyde dehydrogenase family protein [Trebonia sp.]